MPEECHYDTSALVSFQWSTEEGKLFSKLGDKGGVSYLTELLPNQIIVSPPLDFRSPNNYVFLPKCMFQGLGLRPRDEFDIKLVTKTPTGSAVRLRPHTSAFVIEAL
mmetsp:Transcript_27922/g.50525  ORF Transcript_27922/g.50525 Transcript_27922/m.50525 type:complete len:107 (+) Transcript_27922:447-767(+)